jgi:hypothetical protein
MPATVIPGYTFLSGDVLTAARLNAAASGSVPNATDLALGVIQIAGDLAGLATAPSISLALISTYGRTLTASLDAAAARGILGLGSLSTGSTINGSMWSGQDLAVVDGGMGVSDAAGARVNLGAQAQHVSLDQISAIAPAAGTMIFHDGAAYVATPSVAFGRSLLTAADATALRATLQLTPGVDVQPFDAELTQIAAVVPVNGTMLFHNGTNYAATPSVAFGRSILNAADATAINAALGLGSVATENVVPVVKGGTGRTDGANIVRAWVRFDAAGNLMKQYNVASVARTGVGVYLVTFLNPMPDANYCAIATSNADNVASANNPIPSAILVQMKEVGTHSNEDSAGSLLILHD